MGAKSFKSKRRSTAQERKRIETLFFDIRNGLKDQRSESLSTLQLLSITANSKAKQYICEIGVEQLISMLSKSSDSEKEYAVDIIANLCNVTNLLQAIEDVGGTKALVELAQTGNEIHQEKCAFALKLLTMDASAARTAVRLQGVETLVDIVKDGTQNGKEFAAQTLFHLSKTQEFKQVLEDVGGVEHLAVHYVLLAEIGDHKQKETAAEVISHLSTEVGCRLAIEGEKNGIKALIGIAKAGSPSGKGYATEAICNLSRSSILRARIRDSDGVPILLEMMKTGDSRQGEKINSAVMRLMNNAARDSWDSSRDENVEEIDRDERHDRLEGKHLKRKKSSKLKRMISSKSTDSEISKIKRKSFSNGNLNGDFLETEVGLLLKGGKLEKYAVAFFDHGYYTKRQLTEHAMTDEELEYSIGVRDSRDMNILRKLFDLGDGLENICPTPTNIKVEV